MKVKSILVSMFACLSICTVLSGFSACDQEPVEKWTDGLEYELSSDKMYYSVVGMGDCKETEIIIPKTYEGLPVKAIASEAFQSCEELTRVVLPDGMTKIGYAAFSDCDSLAEIIIPSSVTTIDDLAFAECDNLINISIPDGIDVISPSSFSGEKLIYNTYENGKYLGNENNPYLVLVELVSKDSSTFNIAPTTRIIADDVFAFYYKLTSIKIPNSVTKIGEKAFKHCTGLTSIQIPDSVTIISSDVFAECNNLDNVIIGDGVTTIEDDAFAACINLTNVTIGENVTSIADNAFVFCSSLMKVYNKSDFVINTADKSNGFIGCFPSKIYTKLEISRFITDKNGYVFYENEEDVILVGYTGVETEWTLPNTITKIDDYAFYNEKRVTSIIIPNSVTSIGKAAFRGCGSLTSIEIPNSVTSMGYYAFDNCVKLTSIKIPNRLTSISEGAFSGCKSLTEIVIPDSVTSIGDFAFGNCECLKQIVIPDSVTSIGDLAFSYCECLKQIVISNNVTTIRHGAFYNCSSLTEIAIPDGVISIGGSAFSECSSLKQIVIPDSVTSIGNSAFSGCDNLQITEYGNCKYLKKGENPYWALISTTDMNLSSYNIHEDTKLIAGSVFYNCRNVTSIVIPDSVTSIGEYAFSRCDSLISITFKGTVDEWNAIEKDHNWNYNAPISKIICSNGTVTL